MPKNWGDPGVEDMSVLDPGKHFGGQGVKRKKTRKLDDRGTEDVYDTGHQGADMPKRPKNTPPTGLKASGFEKGPKTRY